MADTVAMFAGAGGSALSFVGQSGTGAATSEGAATSWQPTTGGRSLPERIGHLETRYTFRHYNATVAFLVANDDLVNLLIVAEAHVRRIFGRSVGLILDYRVDETIEQPMLYARIQTAADPAESLTLLERLDSEWWDEAAATTKGRLVVTLDPV